MLLTCAACNGKLHLLPHLGGLHGPFRRRSVSAECLFREIPGPRLTGGGILLSSDGLGVLRVTFLRVY
jgi:hypothetical protein